jgi:hypothetical protein
LFLKTLAVLALASELIPTICAEVKAEESELTTFRLAVTFRVPPLKKLVPRAIPAGLPPAVVLRPLMLFEVTMAVMVTPVFGEPTVIPVMLPLAVLRVLIVFEVTLNVAELVTFSWIRFGRPRRSSW